MAIENDLEIIPVMNKIDLPSAMPEEVEDQIVELLAALARISYERAEDRRGSDRDLEYDREKVRLRKVIRRPRCSV